VITANCASTVADSRRRTTLRGAGPPTAKEPASGRSADGDDPLFLTPKKETLMTTTSTRGPRQLSADVERGMLAALRSSLSGEVIARTDSSYDKAHAVWNGLIDRHPAAIARPANTADVVKTVRIAREFRPVVSIRGGGHQVAGSAVCDDGPVIDMSAMIAVEVDPAARVARVQAGARWVTSIARRSASASRHQGEKCRSPG
jgi:hypothetical protein